MMFSALLQITCLFLHLNLFKKIKKSKNIKIMTPTFLFHPLNQGNFKIPTLQSPPSPVKFLISTLLTCHSDGSKGQNESP